MSDQTKPAVLTTKQLAATLREMAGLIELRDSFQGHITYDTVVPGLESDQFEVVAFYRTGNSMGQGGSVIIQGK